MTKYQPGDFVQANNGRGSTYMINRVVPAVVANGFLIRGECYDLDNGSVHIAKRARSGFHNIEKIDRYYRKVN